MYLHQDIRLQGAQDDQWEEIKESLPGKKRDSGRTGTDNRKFINAVIWISPKGAQWRALSESYGK
ncbi:transposase [Holospora curviuscula]|uniref:Insertion element IS402-like domain-containing protein n=1 Tax=Holospora curviuscula TaxID=1082868 RepID=A0A2S5R8K4_9PROT|nr:transposase [Holospora curviuscula]PPE03630.1 hypothetical protein HCUR_00858 [Holospora curviuscula]